MSMFSNFSKFIDQMDAQVGEMVQKQHHESSNHQHLQSSSSNARQHPNEYSVSPATQPLSENNTSNYNGTSESSSKSLPPPPLPSNLSKPKTFNLPPPPPSSSSKQLEEHHQQNENHSRQSSSSVASSSQYNNNQNQNQNQHHQEDPQLQHDFDIAISRLKQATSENEYLHREIETLRRQNDESKSKISSLESKLHKLSEINSSQSNSKQQLEDEFRQLQAHFENLQRENQNLSSKSTLAEESLNAALRESEKAKAIASARILELEHSGEVEEKMAELEAEVAVLKRSLENVRNERDEWKEKVNNVVDANQTQQGSNTNDTNSFRSNNNENLEREIQQLSEKLSSLKKEQEDERTAHRNTRSRYENMLSEKVEEVAILEKQLQRLSSSNSNSNNNNSQNQNTDNSNSGTTTEWEKRAKDLADLVMEKQAALELKRNESDQWRSRYETAQQRLREAELMAAVSTNSNTPSTSSSNHRAITIDPMNPAENSFGDENDISKNVIVSMVTRQLGNTKPYVVAGVSFLRKVDHGVQRIIGSLRRNSILRIAVAFYIFLVHFWILVLIWNAPLPHDGSAATTVDTSTSK